jgi:hypothetical protein
MLLTILPAPFSGAQERADTSLNGDLQKDEHRGVGVQQILPTTKTPAPLGKPIEQVGSEERRPAGVAQLPPDAELGPSAKGPELDLEAVTRSSPEANLYAEVAAVWLLIRRRGQQPTPELIAREIGPDVLAKFLNSFPGSEKMFGVDSDTLPISPPHDAAPPPSAGE